MRANNKVTSAKVPQASMLELVQPISSACTGMANQLSGSAILSQSDNPTTVNSINCECFLPSLRLRLQPHTCNLRLCLAGHRLEHPDFKRRANKLNIKPLEALAAVKPPIENHSTYSIRMRDRYPKL